MARETLKSGSQREEWEGVGRWPLDIEVRVGLLVESEGHWERWRRFGGGFYPVDQVGVELHVRHEDFDRRFSVGLGHLGLGC